MAYQLLLMDDSVTIRRVVELTFAGGDVRVVSVGDGRAAMERIAADPPDVILADVGTAQPDGYAVSAFVKGNPALARIPVLLLSGAFQPIDEDRARESRCDGVLAKPFDPEAVVTRVRQVLRAPGPAGTPPSPETSGEGEDLLAFLEGLLGESDEGPALPENGDGDPNGNGRTRVAAARDVEEAGPASPPPPAPCSLEDYFDLVDAVLARLPAGPSPASTIPPFEH